MSESRLERVEKAVLADEFRQAAEVYAAELLRTEREGQIGNIRVVVHKRERFINAYAMLIADAN